MTSADGENAAAALPHYLARPAAAQDDPPPLLVLLHGVTGDETSMHGFADRFDERFAVVSPRAPNPAQRGGYGWYRTTFTEDGPTTHPEEAEASLDALARFVRASVREQGADPRRVYLVGFSQGAAMAIALLLAEPELVAGVVAMSGRLIPELRHRAAASDRLAGRAALVVHGTRDEILPIEHGRRVRDHLDALPVALAYEELDMAHHITPASLAMVREWLARRVRGAAP